MCNYTLLAHSATGYFIQCKECGHYQFAFGTTEISLSGDELDRLYEKLTCQKYVKEEGALHRKTIRIPLSEKGIAWALTPFEAKQMADLIDEGRATIRVNQLLEETA